MLLAQAAVTATDPISPFISALTSLGGFGLLLTLLLFGRLILKSTYDEMKDDRNQYRTAWETEREARKELENTVETLVEQNRTVIHLLEAIKDGPPRARR